MPSLFTVPLPPPELPPTSPIIHGIRIGPGVFPWPGLIAVVADGIAGNQLNTASWKRELVLARTAQYYRSGNDVRDFVLTWQERIIGMVDFGPVARFVQAATECAGALVEPQQQYQSSRPPEGFLSEAGILEDLLREGASGSAFAELLWPNSGVSSFVGELIAITTESIRSHTHRDPSRSTEFLCRGLLAVSALLDWSIRLVARNLISTPLQAPPAGFEWVAGALSEIPRCVAANVICGTVARLLREGALNLESLAALEQRIARFPGKELIPRIRNTFPDGRTKILRDFAYSMAQSRPFLQCALLVVAESFDRYSSITETLAELPDAPRVGPDLFQLFDQLPFSPVYVLSCRENTHVTAVSGRDRLAMVSVCRSDASVRAESGAYLWRLSGLAQIPLRADDTVVCDGDGRVFAGPIDRFVSTIETLCPAIHLAELRTDFTHTLEQFIRDAIKAAPIYACHAPSIWVHMEDGRMFLVTFAPDAELWKSMFAVADQKDAEAVIWRVGSITPAALTETTVFTVPQSFFADRNADEGMSAQLNIASPRVRTISVTAEFRDAIESFAGSNVPDRTRRLLAELEAGGYHSSKPLHPLVSEIRFDSPATRLYFTRLALNEWVFVWAGNMNNPGDRDRDIEKAVSFATLLHANRKNSTI
jgi:hypothetical protein